MRTVLFALTLMGSSILCAGDVPLTSTLTAPSGAGNSTTPAFEWTAATGATNYDLWVDDLTSGASQAIREQTLTGTSFTPSTALNNNHAYRAWIRAVNEFGASAWSAPQDFGVGTAPIAPPSGVTSLSAPSGAGNSTTPTFQWTTVSGANRYDLWVDDLTTGTPQVIRQQALTGTSFIPTSALTDNHAYRAWIAAGNEFGFGSWSTARDFGVGTAPIAPPTGVSTITAPSGAGNTTTPSYQWTAVAGANRYDLWVDDLTTGASQVIRQQALIGTSFTPTTELADNHAYRAWIAAGNEFGFGSWSVAKDFGVGAAPIAPPTGVSTITAPSGPGNATTPTFQWAPVADANRYDLWVDDLTTGASQVIRQQALIGTSFTPTTAVADNHAYRAWIAAGNEFGFGSWSTARDFGVGTAPIAPPAGVSTITAPSGPGNATTPTFQWVKKQ
jgi:hypothetical protein